MPTLLFRVDDRLIHGQVSIGWAGPLKPDLLLVVDDAAAADAFENDLICCACPETTRAEVVDVAGGPARIARAAAEGRLIVLLREIGTARRLVEAGVALEELNIGGVHHRPGRRAYLPFVYLNDADVEELRWLHAHGVRLSAQDLPGNRATDLVPLLDSGGS